MSDPGTEQQPYGEPEDPRTNNPSTKPAGEPDKTEDPDGTPVTEDPDGTPVTEDPDGTPVTEDPDGTPVENPSGG
ncbi:hypothetical protein [Arthrobacter sp. A5]|uniref:hypothetical protein n=1 Tax=Arthrobacter sp. A5 TaxID=576926 RepID=UPI003DA9CC20